MQPYELLRQIPALDVLLADETIRRGTLRYSERALRDVLRAYLEDLRRRILDTEDLAAFDFLLADQETKIRHFLPDIQERLQEAEEPILRPVINATGILLHTNLGRAPLGDGAAKRVYEILKTYSNLEYDLKAGHRGVRYQALEPVLCKLTGAEAALVVNNNAAAVLLILNELAEGKEVIVSRGELVEIGGAFRIPDVMKKANCTLREIGTTNKTHLYDYENAITEETAMLLKVHQSNFKIVGFSEGVDPKDLVPLKEKYDLPLVIDLGSGLLHPAAKDFLPEEPSVKEAMESGADIVSFSGDKLLGGPQAGIILGKKKYIDRLKKNPYTRAFRIDKMVVAALETTLRTYLDPDRIAHEIPIFSYFETPLRALESDTDAFIDRLIAQGIEAELVHTEGQIGGGSAPGQSFPSVAFAIHPEQYGLTCDAVEAKLRREPVPVIARIQNAAVLFDLRCVSEAERDSLYRSLLKIFVDERD